MASTASTSVTTVEAGPQSMVEIRLQADPLPRKVGEIGYTPSQTSLATSDGSARAMITPSASTASIQSSLTGRAASAAPAPSSRSMPKKPVCFLWRLRSRDAPPLIFGLRACSLIRFVLIFLVVAGTIAGWALAVNHLNAAANSQSASSSSSDDSDDDNDNDESVIQMTGAMYIFVHVAFAIAVLLQLVFLERALFQLRAERWAYLHPGETLPRHTGRGNNTLAFTPWNRPSLPSYAAALGIRGTGDVEDDAIAQPPPPAYGNTRGSTLLLSTALRNSFRRFSARSLTQIAESRPVSYARRDEDAEVISDAERARQLEAALARLEEGGQR